MKHLPKTKRRIKGNGIPHLSFWWDFPLLAYNFPYHQRYHKIGMCLEASESQAEPKHAGGGGGRISSLGLLGEGLGKLQLVVGIVVDRLATCDPHPFGEASKPRSLGNLGEKNPTKN